jgi:hypothetical protein
MLSHFHTFRSQMAVRLSVLCADRFLPTGRFLVFISVRGWVDPRAIVRLEELDKLKISTSSRTRTGNLPACSIAPQPTTPTRDPLKKTKLIIYNFLLQLLDDTCTGSSWRTEWTIKGDVQYFGLPDLFPNWNLEIINRVIVGKMILQGNGPIRQVETSPAFFFKRKCKPKKINGKK